MAGWTCPECGLDYDTISGPDCVVALRSYPRRFRGELWGLGEDEDPDALIRRKPAPDTWSPLAYCVHVAWVIGTIGDAIARMLVEDQPTLGFDDPDAVMDETAANARPVDDVLGDLAASCERAAATLENVHGDEWSRTGVFPWGERDVLTMARNAVHEGHHHLRDVQRGIAANRAAAG